MACCRMCGKSGKLCLGCKPPCWHLGSLFLSSPRRSRPRAASFHPTETLQERRDPCLLQGGGQGCPILINGDEGNSLVENDAKNHSAWMLDVFNANNGSTSCMDRAVGRKMVVRSRKGLMLHKAIIHLSLRAKPASKICLI